MPRRYALSVITITVKLTTLLRSSNEEQTLVYSNLSHDLSVISFLRNFFNLRERVISVRFSKTRIAYICKLIYLSQQDNVSDGKSSDKFQNYSLESSLFRSTGLINMVSEQLSSILILVAGSAYFWKRSCEN